MINPSETASTQDDCPLFKLAAETRNEIYALVFAVETKEDGTVELNDTLASNALTGTCQQIYNESREMHELAYRDLPIHTFTVNVTHRGRPQIFHPDLSDDFYRRMTSFRVNWRADEHNQGRPLRFTSHFDKVNLQRSGWNVRVELHDEYYKSVKAGDRLMSMYRLHGMSALDGFLNTCSWPAGWVRDYRLRDAFASMVLGAVYAGPEQEDRTWRDVEVVRKKKKAVGGMWG